MSRRENLKLLILLIPTSGEHGWDDHNQKQLERLAKLSFAEKLDWLEEAHRLVLQMQAAKTTSRSSRGT